jgi:hypothetical protein
MFMKTNAAALAAALLLAGTMNASAAAVFYADFASWNTAVPSFTSLAIPDPGSSGYIHYGSGTTSTSYGGGVLFGTDAAWGDGDFFNIGPAFSGFPPVLSSQQQTVGLANILITLAAPVKAFALNFDTFNVPDKLIGYDVTFTLSNGETVTLGSAGNSYNLGSFFGVTDSAPFQTILLTSLAPALNINELKLGAAVVAPIPEPATWVMLVLGFLGIGMFGARRSVRRLAAA